MSRFSLWFFGKSKDPLDKDIFHKMSLVAFLAWVGLGADGLSSSSYGPEEAFKVLGSHQHLAILLALATMATVFVISASYTQILELFPSGGGGYVVSSKILGNHAGLVSGSALVIDYILTVAMSISAAASAIFSNLPPEWIRFRFTAIVIFMLSMIWLNLRGIKESIKVLLPIFFVFIISHLILFIAGIGLRFTELPAVLANAWLESRSMVHGKEGLGGLLVLLFTAYSMGGGTYTGIEAVANGLGNMAEPRVRTGKKTMLYMAASLAVTAGGILFCYMLWSTPVKEGQTMNAVLIEQIFGLFHPFGLPLGRFLVSITIWSEALLLFIAAQTGFVDGPIVLSNMAVDSWLPHRFSHLSSRLVRINGILFMGIAALAVLWFTRGDIGVLVVLYAINVFITFTLSQFSMCVHWWRNRQTHLPWRHGLLINAAGLCMTLSILIAMIVFKFRQGGWITLMVTGILVTLCLLVKNHYLSVNGALKRLDDLLLKIPFPVVPPQPREPEPFGPTAVLLVNGYSGLGIHAIFSIRKLFKPDYFKNLIFLQVGRIDSSRFKGVEELENLKISVETGLKRYVDLARGMGYASEYHFKLSNDVLPEITGLCEAAASQYVEPTFFSAKLVFAKENWINRFLHHQTSLELQQRLLFKGLQAVVLPVRVL